MDRREGVRSTIKEAMRYPQIINLNLSFLPLQLGMIITSSGDDGLSSVILLDKCSIR